MTDLHLLTRAEAAQRARIGVSTLGRLIRDGRGPVLTHVASKSLVREDHLREWLEACAAPREERLA